MEVNRTINKGGGGWDCLWNIRESIWKTTPRLKKVNLQKNGRKNKTYPVTTILNFYSYLTEKIKAETYHKVLHHFISTQS